MDKVRKFGQWLWVNKERMVLAVLVLIMFTKMYQVVSGPMMDSSPTGHRPPGPNLPDPWEGAPPRPGPPPEPMREKPVAALVAGNMFTVHGGGAQEETEQEITPDQLGITLVRIVPWSGGDYRAELRDRTGNVDRYQQGEQFQNFRLERINPGANEVQIWSDEYGRVFTLTAEQ